MKTRGTKTLNFKKQTVTELDGAVLRNIIGGIRMHDNQGPVDNGTVIDPPFDTSVIRPFTNTDRPLSGAVCGRTGM